MYKYYINDSEVSQVDFEKELESNNFENCELNFEQFLNKNYPRVNIGVGEYPFGLTLKLVDYIRYREMLNDFADSRFKEILYNLEKGSLYNINDIQFQIKDC